MNEFMRLVIIGSFVTLVVSIFLLWKMAERVLDTTETMRDEYETEIAALREDLQNAIRSTEYWQDRAETFRYKLDKAMKLVVDQAT